MNNDNLYGFQDALLGSDFELEWENYPKQIAAAEFAIEILSSPSWNKDEKQDKLIILKRDVEKWWTNDSPFSSKKWIDMPSTWKPLTELERNFYTNMNMRLETLIKKVLYLDVGDYDDDPPFFPAGHVLLFYELGRLIMGTVNYTNLSREYIAWIGTDIYTKTTNNSVKIELQQDHKWIALLKDMVGLVGCIEEEFKSNAESTDFNPNTARFNLTKMKAFFRESIEEMKEKQISLEKDKTEKEVATAVAVASNRKILLRLMHRLSQLT
jgi:hypothetical protein